jgi:hypothetical protein
LSASTSGHAEVVPLAEGRFLFKVPGRFEPPDTSTRGVGVIDPAAATKLVRSATENQFLNQFHSEWPETKDLRLPSALPAADGRVDGPGEVVAARSRREVDTPLVRRTLLQLVIGKQGENGTRVLCGGGDDFIPAAFSPDGHVLGLTLGTASYILDVSGDRGATELFQGRILDWRP